MINREVISLEDERLERAAVSLNLHANAIEDLTGLGSFTHLTSLNLSSNQIRTVHCESLGSLTALDLASNRIQRVNGLSVLTSLRKLNLAFNRICDLDGLKLRKLFHLDLRANRLADLSRLRSLTHCCTLAHLSLQSAHGDRSNPVCALPGYAAALLTLVPTLRRLDEAEIERPLREGASALRPTPAPPPPAQSLAWLQQAQQLARLETRIALMEAGTADARARKTRGGATTRSAQKTRRPRAVGGATTAPRSRGGAQRCGAGKRRARRGQSRAARDTENQAAGPSSRPPGRQAQQHPLAAAPACDGGAALVPRPENGRGGPCEGAVPGPRPEVSTQTPVAFTPPPPAPRRPRATDDAALAAGRDMECDSGTAAANLGAQHRSKTASPPAGPPTAAPGVRNGRHGGPDGCTPSNRAACTARDAGDHSPPYVSVDSRILAVRVGELEHLLQRQAANLREEKDAAAARAGAAELALAASRGKLKRAERGRRESVRVAAQLRRAADALRIEAAEWKEAAGRRDMQAQHAARQGARLREQLSRCQSDLQRAQLELVQCRSQLAASASRERRAADALRLRDQGAQFAQSQMAEQSATATARATELGREVEEGRRQLATLRDTISSMAAQTAQREAADREAAEQREVLATATKAAHAAALQQERDRASALLATQRSATQRAGLVAEDELRRADRDIVQLKSAFKEAAQKAADVKELLRASMGREAELRKAVEGLSEALRSAQRQAEEEKRVATTADAERAALQERHSQENDSAWAAERAALAAEILTLSTKLDDAERKAADQRNVDSQATLAAAAATEASAAEALAAEQKWRVECDELRKNAMELEAAVDVKNKMLDDQNGTINQLKQHVSRAEGKVTEVDRDLAEAEERLAKAGAHAASHRAIVAEYEAIITELKSQKHFTSLKKQLEGKEAALQLVDKEINALREAFAQQTRALEKQQEANRRSALELSGVEHRLAEQVQACAAAAERYVRAEEANEALQQRWTHQEQVSAAALARAEGAEAELARVRGALTSVLSPSES